MSGQDVTSRDSTLNPPENWSGRRLDSWKAIAGYFGRAERTVKRWEVTRGLPVRRLPNGPRSAVFAYENELAAWLAQGTVAAGAAAAPLPEPPATAEVGKRRWKNWLALGTIAGVSIAAVAAAVWFALPAALGPGARPASQPARRPANAQAANFYSSGLYEWQARTPSGLQRAVDDFTQAIVHDPGFAPAYVGLADAYNLLPEYTTMPPEDAYPRAEAAAERAVALDPSSGEAHAALAFDAFYWSRDPVRARREFTRALGLMPRSATVHHWYATFLMTMGEGKAALAEIRTAEALDSASTAIRADEGDILFFAGDPDAAAMLLRGLESTGPQFSSPHLYMSVIDRTRGDNDGYLREMAEFARLRHDESGATVAAAGARGLASAGRQGMFKAMLRAELGLWPSGGQSAYDIAASYGLLADPSQALFWLRVSIARKETASIAMRIDPAFASLRKTRTFQELLHKAGLA